MKINALTKHLSASAIILGLAVSCGTPPEKDTADSGVSVPTGELAADKAAREAAAAQAAADAKAAEKAAKDAAAKKAAQNAINNAESSLTSAKGENAEWRDTGKVIKASKKALAAGDYAKAKSLAEMANSQNQIAIAQAGVEAGKFQAATEFNASESSSAAATSNSNLVTSYTVESGDSLWGISSSTNVYDDPYKWPLIYKENSSKINDPDLIFPGQDFDINQNVLSEDADAAISHARNRGAWTIGGAEQSDADYLAK